MNSGQYTGLHTQKAYTHILLTMVGCLRLHLSHTTKLLTVLTNCFLKFLHEVTTIMPYYALHMSLQYEHHFEMGAISVPVFFKTGIFLESCFLESNVCHLAQFNLFTSSDNDPNQPRSSVYVYILM